MAPRTPTPKAPTPADELAQAQAQVDEALTNLAQLREQFTSGSSTVTASQLIEAEALVTEREQYASQVAQVVARLDEATAAAEHVERVAQLEADARRLFGADRVDLTQRFAAVAAELASLARAAAVNNDELGRVRNELAVVKPGDDAAVTVSTSTGNPVLVDGIEVRPLPVRKLVLEAACRAIRAGGSDDVPYRTAASTEPNHEGLHDDFGVPFDAEPDELVGPSDRIRRISERIAGGAA